MTLRIIFISLVIPFFSFSQNNPISKFYWQPELFSSGKVYCYTVNNSKEPAHFISFSLIKGEYSILKWDKDYRLREVQKIAFKDRGVIAKGDNYILYGTRDTLKLIGEVSYGELFPFNSKILEIHWIKCYKTSTNDTVLDVGTQSAKKFHRKDTVLIFEGTNSFEVLGKKSNFKSNSFKRTTFKKEIGIVREEIIINDDTTIYSLSEIIESKVFEDRMRKNWAEIDSVLLKFKIDKQQVQNALNESKFRDSSVIVYNLILDSIAARKRQEYQAKLALGLKVQSIKKQGDSIKVVADDLFSLIENFKSDLIYKMTGGLDEDGIPVGKDNIDAGAHYFLISNNGEKGKILEEKMDAYRIFLLSIVKDTAVANRIDKMLATDDTKEQKWIELLSSHLPLAAVTANLTLLQTFVRNAEAESIEYLVSELDKK